MLFLNFFSISNNLKWCLGEIPNNIKWWFWVFFELCLNCVQRFPSDFYVFNVFFLNL